jgi:hypothetical protein
MTLVEGSNPEESRKRPDTSDINVAQKLEGLVLAEVTHGESNSEVASSLVVYQRARGLHKNHYWDTMSGKMKSKHSKVGPTLDDQLEADLTIITLPLLRWVVPVKSFFFTDVDQGRTTFWSPNFESGYVSENSNISSRGLPHWYQSRIMSRST